MAGKGDEGGYGEGDNVHKGSGSKSGDGFGKMPEGKAEGDAVGGKDTTFAEGGHSNHMFGEQNSDEQSPGGTAHKTGNDMDDGCGGQFTKGGSTKMFGYNPSVPATAGITGPR